MQSSQVNGGATTAPPTPSQTLPPISSSEYMQQDMLGSRAQPLQPSLMNAERSPLDQPQPVYAPTGTTFITPQGQINGYSQPTVAPQVYKASNPQYSSVQTQPTSFYQTPERSTRLPNLRPMPINTFNGDHLGTPHGTPPGSATRLSDDLGQPIHVVGSQGRRGILPSVAGRPPALGEDTANGSRNAVNPVKDSNGKFPCEHCQKTYLHAKHLKRHMLRRECTEIYMC